MTTALAGGQLVLVLTGEDLANAPDPQELITLLQRRMLDQVKGQVLALAKSQQQRPKNIKTGKTINKRNAPK